MEPKDFELMLRVLDDVITERHRQHAKWGRQRHPLLVWLAILMEEVGEFATAIQRGFGWGEPTDPANKYEEVIQIAAVALATAEQLKEEAERGQTDSASPSSRPETY